MGPPHDPLSHSALHRARVFGGWRGNEGAQGMRYLAPLNQQRGTGRRFFENREWNESDVAKLRAEWATGASTAEIGRRMGITKNAVIGKARRLKLPRRAAPPNIAKPDSPRVPPTARVKAGRADFSRQTRPATTSRLRAGEPGAAATTALDVSSSQNLPEADAETLPPRVFLGTECKFPLHGDERPIVPRFCAEPVRDNAKGCASSYCAAHYALCYAAPAKNPSNPPPASWLKNRGAWRVGA